MAYFPHEHDSICSFEWLQLCIALFVVTNFTFECLFFLHELMQYGFSSYLFEKIRGHELEIWIACFHHSMLFHGTLLRSMIVTNLKFEWLIVFMNWCNMVFKVTFSRHSISLKLPIWTNSFYHELFQHVVSFWNQL